MIPIYRSHLPPASLSYAHEALNSSWVSSKGDYLLRVQNALQTLLKPSSCQQTPYVLPLHNGTHACHLLAKALHKKHGINKVIVPNNVYVAAWNGFLFDGNYELHAIEPSLDTWNYDLHELDKAIQLHPTAAVLIVHNVGNIINVPSLQQKYPNTIFVEDNCEGFLGKYNDQYSGTKSFASAISFYGNKNITSGEGGAFITNDQSVYDYAYLLQAQGQSSTKFVHHELGYNYRMTNVQAAILLGQLEILPSIIEMKRAIFNRYRAHLKDREDILFQVNEAGTENANWMFGVRIPNKPNHSYQLAELFFRKNGVEIRPMFYPIDAHDYLRENHNVMYGDCSKAKILNEQCFILPSYPDLTTDEQKHILKTLDEYVGSYISIR